MSSFSEPTVSVKTQALEQQEAAQSIVQDPVGNRPPEEESQGFFSSIGNALSKLWDSITATFSCLSGRVSSEIPTDSVKTTDKTVEAAQTILNFQKQVEEILPEENHWFMDRWRAFWVLDTPKDEMDIRQLKREAYLHAGNVDRFSNNKDLKAIVKDELVKLKNSLSSLANKDSEEEGVDERLKALIQEVELQQRVNSTPVSSQIPATADPAPPLRSSAKHFWDGSMTDWHQTTAASTLGFGKVSSSYFMATKANRAMQSASKSCLKQTDKGNKAKRFVQLNEIISKQVDPRKGAERDIWMLNNVLHELQDEKNLCQETQRLVEIQEAIDDVQGRIKQAEKNGSLDENALKAFDPTKKARSMNRGSQEQHIKPLTRMKDSISYYIYREEKPGFEPGRQTVSGQASRGQVVSGKRRTRTNAPKTSFAWERVSTKEPTGIFKDFKQNKVVWGRLIAGVLVDRSGLPREEVIKKWEATYAVSSAITQKTDEKEQSVLSSRDSDATEEKNRQHINNALYKTVVGAGVSVNERNRGVYLADNPEAVPEVRNKNPNIDYDADKRSPIDSTYSAQ